MEIKKHETLKTLLETGVVAVVRAENEQEAENISRACLEGGIRAVEITYTVPNATEVIQSLVKKFPNGEMVIGAGSVLDSETARIAILAGAEYIVSPCFDKETAMLCNRYQIPYMPGCMTITEMKVAMEYGAEVLKLFPGSNFGPNFIKAVNGPLPQANVMPTGGVNLDNATEWIQNGAVAIGIGSDLTRPAKKGDFEKITELARRYCDIVQAART